MANWAAQIPVLSVSGSRLSDGTANASGKVWFFQPGTSTTVQVYSDAAATTVVTQPITLGSGGRLPSNLSGGVFATQPVRMYIESATSGTVVSDTVYIPATAGNVGLDNDGWTATTEDGAWTALYTSLGGTDGTYKESGGATARTLKAKFAELCISVKDFGAVGDGVNIDTTAIQAAVSRAKALGGGVVYFPPGTYLIDQAITLTDADGVSIVGSGSSTVTQTNATANAFTISTCDDLRFQDIDVTHSTTSSGYAFSLTTCTRVLMIRATAGNVTTGGTYLRGLSATSCTDMSLFGCTFASTGGGNRAIVLSSTSRFAMFGGNVQTSGGGTAQFGGSAGLVSFHGVLFSGTLEWLLGLTGVGFDFFSCSGAFFSVLTATIPQIRVFGGDPQSSTTTGATGAAQTPSLIDGSEVILIAASGGVGTVTVNAPAVLPPTTATNLYWDFVFKNAASGAVTWTLNAVFVVNAAIPTTDAHTVGVRFRWDGSTSKLREVSRADTVT